MNEPKDKNMKNLEIQLDEEVAQGTYTNFVVAQHSHSEFLFDFIFLAPGQAKAKVHTRIIMAPEHAKRLLKVLQDNVAKYESRFGEIALPEMNHVSAPSKTMQ